MESDFILPKRQKKVQGDVSVFNQTDNLVAVKVRLGEKGKIEVYVYELSHEEF